MNSTFDDELLKQARQFDLSALTAIYDQYNSGLYYYALRLLGNRTMAEDCISETFSHLLQALRNGGGPKNNLKGYLYRSVHNWVTDHYRQKATLDVDMDCELPDSHPDTDVQVEQNLACQQVRTALQTLTPDQRQVITLHFLEGWDLAEIASSLRKPIGAIKSLQHRGLQSLQKYLLEAEKVKL